MFLALADEGADGLEEFGRVVADAVLGDGLFDVGDVDGGVAVDEDEVGLLAGGDGADAVRLAQEPSSVLYLDVDGFDGGEVGFD